MALPALKFIPGASGIDHTRSELADELIRSFQQTRLQSTPCAFVVLNKDLSDLLRFKDLVINRGRKHKAKPLAKLLLGHTKIPFINGSYESSGQLLRSVRTLLDNAFARDDHNIYIIGTSEKIFEELWSRAPSKRTDARRDSSQSSGIELSPGADLKLSSQRLLELLPQQEIPQDFLRTFIGSSVEVQLIRQLVMRAAASDDAVLVLGNTGTGKEVIARSIHKYSPRASEKFVPVNCGAIPSELLESELFGHKRGAFTDAKYDKKGLWEITGNGTLFLDEVGDLAVIHQVKILRALEENKVRPIGAEKEVSVKARVIAATNRDLFSMVKAGQFREDLYYRLRTFLIRTPVLRDHPEDIPVLARSFWQKIAHDKTVLPDELLDELQSYSWPGNARELKAVLMSLHTLFGGDRLDSTRLRAVFQIHGPSYAEADGLEGQAGLITHRIDSLRHLRRVDEVLRACVLSAKTLVETRQADESILNETRESLRARLGELEQLCLNPLRFHGQVTFDVVNGLRERLSYFYGLLEGDYQSALSYWKTELTRDLMLASTAIFEESQRLEKNI